MRLRSVSQNCIFGFVSTFFLLLMVGCIEQTSAPKVAPSVVAESSPVAETEVVSPVAESSPVAETEVVSPTAIPEPITKITLLQMNDVYEIEPVSGGELGGLARVATLRKQLLTENPNTFTLLAGDLFSPSALGTAKVGGQKIDGQQAVEAMNALGLDYMTLGNHEFDISRSAFEKRLSETHFKIISSNVFSPDGKLFEGVLENHIFTVEDKVNGPVRVGIFGVVLEANKVNYVTYTKALETARKEVKALRDKVDILIALTHLDYPSDLELARTTPGIDIILGGHEHENMQFWRGDTFTPLFKADANATSVYIHDLFYKHKDHSLEIRSRLKRITPALADDPKTAQVVKKWVKIAFEGFAKDGIQAKEVITTTNIVLDGLEANIRNRPTELTKIIANGMLHEAQGTELAIFYGGSVRLDDVIPPGKITQYDIIRTLPFDSKIVAAEIKGAILKKILDKGQKSKGSGGYLQTTPNVQFDEATKDWLIDSKPLNPDQIYKAAIDESLVEDTNADKSSFRVGSNYGSLRKIFINELKRAFGPQN